MRYVIIGASRGLGMALAKGLPEVGDQVFCVSRTAAKIKNEGVEYQWAEADAGSDSFSDDVLDVIGNTPVDVFIYNTGISDSVPFTAMSENDLSNVLRINLESFVRLSSRLLPNILNGDAKTIIAISSTCGLPNEGTEKVAFAASKFGLRGAIHGLREALRRFDCRVTVISPGSIATDIDFELGPGTALDQYEQQKIPVHDLIETVKYVLSLSPASCVKEIHMPATADGDV